MRMVNRIARALATAALVAVWPGAGPGGTASAAAPRAPKPTLEAAQALFEQGRHAEALMMCVDLTRIDPHQPGLAELRERLIARTVLDRDRVAALRAASTQRQLELDLHERMTMPDTYGVRRFVKGESGSLKSLPSAMEATLSRKVTMHLDQVGLADFILAIGQSDNVNIVADDAASSKTMSIHADQVPLIEILEYVARNLGVAFYAGEHIIWATPSQDAASPVPMLTRVYRLRKGMAGSDLAGGGAAADGAAAETSIEAALRRFVPEIPGSDLLFDPKAHAVIAKNTRENLARVEEILDALDVAPLQVQIEARFVAMALNELRELGIDWLLNSDWVVSSKPVVRDGQVVMAPRTQIDDGANITNVKFPNTQGLNLTYRGLLTEPMFQAVIHALETSGKAHTLSAPQVTTVNNRPAKIRVGEDFRYFEEYDVVSVPSSTQEGGTVYRSVLVPVGTPTLEELGIELNVTPSVGADNAAIVLALNPEISEFVRYEYYQVASDYSGRERGGIGDGASNVSTNFELSTIKLPIFRRSMIETEVVVRSGETVVMGGLILSTQSKSRSGVPFISKLPLIGRLFSSEGINEDKKNLLIFVTASLLSDRGENLIPIADEAAGGETPPPGEAAPADDAPAPAAP